MVEVTVTHESSCRVEACIGPDGRPQVLLAVTEQHPWGVIGGVGAVPASTARSLAEALLNVAEWVERQDIIDAIV